MTPEQLARTLNLVEAAMSYTGPRTRDEETPLRETRGAGMTAYMIHCHGCGLMEVEAPVAPGQCPRCGRRADGRFVAVAKAWLRAPASGEERA